MVDILNLPDALIDATLKRKWKSKKVGEGTSNPPLHSPAKQPKKYETSKRILRFVDTEASEVQKREDTEAAKAFEVAEVAKVTETTRAFEGVRATETTRAVEAVRAVEATSVAEASKAIEATSAAESAKAIEAAKAAGAARIVEELRHLTKKAEREYAKVFAQHNPCKSSNVVTSTIYNYIIINTSSIPLPIRSITNPTNTIETTWPENTIFPQDTINPIRQQPRSPSHSQHPSSP